MDRFFDNSRAATREDTLDMDVNPNSPAIRRLVEEVRAEEEGVPRSYNRTFIYD